jgi:phage terminase large subunit-like protein
MWLKSYSVWISADLWKENAGAESVEQMRESLKGRLCFGGLDLALVKDLSVLTLCFPPEKIGEPIKYLKWAWCPEDNAYARLELDAVPYIEWSEKGYLELTPGNVTDFNYIEKKILELCEVYNIHSIGYDPYKSTHLVTNLLENSVTMEVFAQKPATMHPAISEFERLVISKQIAHGNDPLFAWCISNAVLSMSAQGNIRLDREASADKIDAAVSAVMSLGQWSEHRDITETQIYFAVL